MLAAICHDFGKPATTEFLDGHWRSHGHDEAGVAPTVSFLDRLNIHTLQGYDVRSQTIALVRDHLRPGEFYNRREEISDAAFRRLAARCELDLLYRLSLADNMSRNVATVPHEKRFTPDAQEWFIRRVRELAVEERPPAPILLGRHLIELGLAPSPQFKTILDAIYEQQLEGKVSDLEQARDAARQLLAPTNEE
jgi:tRNA nucleotidyltransferase (CCA-adding enzyme)